MKNLFKSMMLVAAAATGFAACSTDATEEFATPEVKGATKTITVSTDITRTQFGADRTELAWSADDEFGVFTDVAADKNLSSGTYSSATDGAYTLEVSENATMVYAYYPYYKGNSSKSATGVNFGVPETQQWNGPGILYGKNIPMVASGAIEGSNVSLTFKRIACTLALNIYGGKEGETLQSITFTTEENCAGRMDLDITGDEIAYEGNTKSVVVTPYKEAVIPADATAVADKQTFENQTYLTVVKKSYAAGATFVVKTSENTYTFTTKKALDCSAADFMPVNLDLTKGETEEPIATKTYAKVTTAPADWSGTYIIAYEGNILTGLMRGTSDYLEKETVTTYDETSITCSSVYEITIEKAATDGYYTLKNSAGQYIGWVSSTKAQVADKASSDNFLWALKLTAQTITTKANSSRNIRYNGSTDYRVYSGTSTGNAPSFYVYSGPSVSVSESTFALKADDTEEHTFTCSVSGEGADPAHVTLTQESGADWLNASYANGTVTYSAKTANTGEEARTATLTLSIADGNSVTVTVTQAAPAKKLTVTLSAEGTVVSWSAAPAAAGYNYTVTADAEGTGEVLKNGDNVSDTSIDLSKLGLETGTYYVHVQALGDNIATIDSDVAHSTGIAVEKSEEPTIIFEEDFASITAGDNTSTSGSSRQWSGNANFPSYKNAYQAGGAIRLGTSKSNGSVTSKTLDLSKPFTVTVDVKGWTNVEGTLKITVGSQSKTITYTETYNGAFGTYIVEFDAATNSSTITIATSAKRAFIDNVKLHINKMYYGGSYYMAIAIISYYFKR